MRFVLTLEQAIAVGGLMFCASIGWQLGRWLTDKLLSFVR